MAEKETLSVNKCPDKMPKRRTKLQAQQPLLAHQPHALVSEGFTVKAMMKNSVVSDPPELNALPPIRFRRRQAPEAAGPPLDSELCPGWSLPKMAITGPVAQSPAVWRSRLGH